MTRSRSEIARFAPGQYWVSSDRQRFAEVTEVSGEWAAAVSITDCTGNKIAWTKVYLPQFQEHWRLVPEDL